MARRGPISPPADFIEPFSMGYVSGRTGRSLGAGEMQECDGCHYEPYDATSLFKSKGRDLLGDTGVAARIKGIAAIQFDDGVNNRLLMLNGTVLYSMDPLPSALDSPVSFVTGLSADNVGIDAAHYNDRFYVALGVDRNRVIESDGSVYIHGMTTPQEAPDVSGSNGPQIAGTVDVDAASISNSGFTNIDRSTDGDDETFAHAELSTPGTATAVWGGIASGVEANRVLNVRWGVGGRAIDEAPPRDRGSHRDEDAGFIVNVLIEYSINNGGSWNDLVRVEGLTRSQDAGTVGVTIGAGTNSDQVRTRATFTYVSGTTTAALRVFRGANITDGSQVVQAETNGLQYAIAEWDSKRDEYSPVGAASPKVALDGITHTSVLMGLPAAAQNVRATHWVIYRNPGGEGVDGTPGSVPGQLGQVGVALISATTFVDNFTIDSPTEGPTPLANFMPVTDSKGVIYFPRDQEPPAFSVIHNHMGSLAGIALDRVRSLRYSPPGRPGSFPEVYNIKNFPLEENDRLVAMASAGRTLIIGAQGAMLRASGLPLILNNRYTEPEVTTIQGQPGCVSRKGMVAYSVGGEVRVAWVSEFGIHGTDGVRSDTMTDDLDWRRRTGSDGIVRGEVSVPNLNTSILDWDNELRALIFVYDSDGDGVNDRFKLFHMDPTHRKENGMPKITNGFGTISSLSILSLNRVQYIYTGHESDGKVYLERTGLVDDSNAFDGSGTHPLQVTTRKIYPASWDEYTAMTGMLRHSQFTPGQTMSLAWTQGTESPVFADTVNDTLSLDSDVEFWIHRSGEYGQARLVHTGQSDGRLEGMRIIADVMNQATS